MVLQKTNSTFCSKVWNWKQDNVFFVQQCVAGERSLEAPHCTAAKTEVTAQRHWKADDSGEQCWIKSNLEGLLKFHQPASRAQGNYRLFWEKLPEEWQNFLIFVSSGRKPAVKTLFFIRMKQQRRVFIHCVHLYLFFFRCLIFFINRDRTWFIWFVCCSNLGVNVSF